MALLQMLVSFFFGLQLVDPFLSVLEIFSELSCLLLALLESQGYFLVIVGGNSQFFIGTGQL